LIQKRRLINTLCRRVGKNIGLEIDEKSTIIMKNFIKGNWFKLIIVIVLLVVGSVAIYYYSVFKPEQDRAALQQQISAQNAAQQAAQQQQAQSEAAAQAQAAAQATAKEQQLKNCVDSAHQDYVKQGQFDCENAGYTQTQIDNGECLLPHAESQAVLQAQIDAETLCATLYK
jgi:type II secretory pathway component PulM